MNQDSAGKFQQFVAERDIPDRWRIKGAISQREYLINGELHQWAGPMQEVYSPICVESEQGVIERLKLGAYPMLGKTEAENALNAAANAYDNGRGRWPTMTIQERISHIETFTSRMIEKKWEIVVLLMWEIGKTLRDSEKEFDRTVEYIRDTISALKELDRRSSRFVIEKGVIGQIKRAPLGVVLCMGPFNYPLNETFTTLIPALIMGNSIIFKPPKLGVLLHGPLLEVFRDSFPAGVVNTVYGDGQEVIGPLMASGKIDALAFIGSSKVANILQKQHPKPHRCRFVLGLEAKNASIVLPDADLDLVVREHVLGTLSYNGQRCTALKMLFVHKDIADVFLKRFSAAIEELKIGMPWEQEVFITPLPEENKTEYLASLVDDAVRQGAKVINRSGGRFERTCYYPTIVYPVSSTMRLYAEEQFGPVIPVTSFESIETPISYIINSNFGQQVSIFSNNSDVIADLIDPLVNQVCRVNINSQCQRGPDIFPFTGRKDSAEGTLSVSDALKVFSIRSLVAAKENDLNKKVINEIVREHKSNFLSTDFIF